MLNRLFGFFPAEEKHPQASPLSPQAFMQKLRQDIEVEEERIKTYKTVAVRALPYITYCLGLSMIFGANIAYHSKYTDKSTTYLYQDAGFGVVVLGAALMFVKSCYHFPSTNFNPHYTHDSLLINDLPKRLQQDIRSFLEIHQATSRVIKTLGDLGNYCNEFEPENDRVYQLG